MESLSKSYYRRLREQYQREGSMVPHKVAMYDICRGIGRLWGINELQGRSWDLDRSHPYYLKLKLGPHDDLCREGMLFLEHIETVYNLKFADAPPEYTHLYGDDLVQFNSSDIWLIFQSYNMSKCIIIDSKVARPTYTKRTVIC